MHLNPPEGNDPNNNKNNCTKSNQGHLRQTPIDINQLHHNVTLTSASVVAPCLLPQYHMYTWVLAMVCLASFLKLNYMIKSAILLVMVIVYTSLMVAAYPGVFDEIQVTIN